MCGRCLERGPGGDDHGLIDQQDYFQPEFFQLHWPEHEAIRGVPGGAGRMRKLSAFGMIVLKKAVDWEEGWRYTYRLRHGIPFRWHQGDVFVCGEHGLTRVRWAIRFESWIPLSGRLTARVLQKIFATALCNLKAELKQ